MFTNIANLARQNKPAIKVLGKVSAALAFVTTVTFVGNEAVKAKQHADQIKRIEDAFQMYKLSQNYNNHANQV